MKDGTSSKSYQTYYMDVELIDKVKDHAKETHLKKSAIVTIALTEYFKNLKK